MSERFSRTEMLIGSEKLEKLSQSKVVVFGAGGVGGYVIEALARCNVGAIDIVDNDKISESNLNRQIFALESTIGRYKVDVAKERILDINPDAKVNVFKIFYTPDSEFDFSVYDYVVDAIDTVSSKIDIIIKAKAANVPVISSMGTGNKLNPTEFEVADIYQTSVCPLAKVMRYELRKRGVESLKVVYSKENPQKSAAKTPSSIAFVPPAAGLIIASEVVNVLTNVKLN